MNKWIETETPFGSHVLNTLAKIGAIGSFNKILLAVRADASREIEECELRETLEFLCNVDWLHHLKRSDTYLINESRLPLL